MNKIFTTCLLVICGMSTALSAGDGENSKKETGDLNRSDAYKVFIARVLSTNNGAALAPSAILTISDKSSLDVSLPIYPWVAPRAKYDYATGVYKTNTNTEANNRVFFLLTGRISSSDKYTPLVQNAKWKPDAEVGGSLTYLIRRSVKFYKAEIYKNFSSSRYPEMGYIGEIDTMPIYKASQINYWWLNIRGGYKHMVCGMFDTINRPFADAAFDTVGKGAYLSANLNWYLYPSKMKAHWFTMYWQVGVDYVQNAVNLSTLDKIKGTVSRSYQQNGVEIEEVLKDMDARKVYSKKDTLKVGWSVDIPLRANFVFNTMDHEFYIGVGGYFNQKFWKGGTRSDVGLLMNVPVTQKKGDKSSVVNLQLQVVWEDVNNRYKPEGMKMPDYRKQKFSVGFTVAAPLMPSHIRKDKKG